MIGDISLNKAREISINFCKHFDLNICQIFYVDKIIDENNDICFGIYNALVPENIMVAMNCPNRAGILMHELTHHLEYSYFNNLMEYLTGKHGYFYQLAKKRVIRWCNKNISNNINWRIPLKGKIYTNEFKKFGL